MEVKGKIVRKFELQSGVGKASGKEWKKQEYLIDVTEDGAQYPKQFVFHFFGDRVNENNLEPGDVVTLSFDIESREYNGRWYTDVRAWRAQKEDGTASATSQASAAAIDPAAPGLDNIPADLSSDSGTGDDLPF